MRILMNVLTPVILLIVLGTFLYIPIIKEEFTITTKLDSASLSPKDIQKFGVAQTQMTDVTAVAIKKVNGKMDTLMINKHCIDTLHLPAHVKVESSLSGLRSYLRTIK